MFERTTTRRRLATLLAATVIGVLPGAAGAAELGWQASVTGSTGYDANPGASRGATSSGTFFGQVAPELVGAIATARAFHRLSYTFFANLFFDDLTPNTYAHLLAYRSEFDLGPTVRLTLGASATYTSYNALPFQTPASASTATATTLNTGRYIAPGAHQGLSWDVGDGWVASESLSFSMLRPLDDGGPPTTYTTTLALGTRRSFSRHAVGGRAGLGYDTRDRNPTTGPRPFAEHQLVPSLVAVWIYDINASLALEVNAGALAVVPAEDPARTFFHPTGLAALRYGIAPAAVALTYRHEPRLNPYLGNSFMVDQVRLGGALPLDRKLRFGVAASIAYEHGLLIEQGSSGVFGGSTHTFVADGGLLWRVSRYLSMGVRYQYTKQVGFSEDRIVAGRPQTVEVVPSYDRHLAMFSFTARYPAEIPTRSLPLVVPTRADGGAPASAAEAEAPTRR